MCQANVVTFKYYVLFFTRDYHPDIIRVAITTLTLYYTQHDVYSTHLSVIRVNPRQALLYIFRQDVNLCKRLFIGGEWKADKF